MWLLLILILICVACYSWERKSINLLAWKLNGPIAYPIIGSAYIFADTTSKSHVLMKRFQIIFFLNKFQI